MRVTKSLAFSQEPQEALHMMGVDQVSYPSDQALEICRKVGAVTPHWVPIITSKKKMPPWMGACLWIIEHEGILLPLIQRREKNRPQEEIAHELIHAARISYYSPRFEELIAFQTSAQPWRRVWSPLIRSQWEIPLTMGALLFAPFFPGVALSWCALGFGRLARSWSTWNRCHQSLVQKLGSGKQAQSLMIRLTDQQIHHFASSHSQFPLSFNS